MELKEYEPYWIEAKPLMTAKLEAIKQHLQGNIKYDLSEIYSGGDEEFRVSLDITRADGVVLGIDFTLLDADVNGAESGVGIKLGLTGFGGLVIGGYAPYNYTEDAFTTEMDEMTRRIMDLDAAEMANFIMSEALVDTRLLKELDL